MEKFSNDLPHLMLNMKAILDYEETFKDLFSIEACPSHCY
jgi:hypothetical protein